MAALPPMIPWGFGWTATGKFNTISIEDGKTVEPTIPLLEGLWAKRAPLQLKRHGNPVVLVEVMPRGNSLVTTVDPTQFPQFPPLGVCKDFPFKPFVVRGGEEVALVATYTESWPVVLPINQANVKVDGTTVIVVDLDVQLIWRTRVPLGPGVAFEPVVPLMLDGDTCEGWESPVTIQLQLPNGNTMTNTVDIKDIQLGKFKDFRLPKLDTAGGSGELEITVIANRTGGSPSMLFPGDVDIKQAPVVK